MIRILFSGLLLSLFIVNHVFAKNDFAEDRSALKSLMHEIETAINARDIDQLASKLHEDVVVTFLNAEVARGIPAVRAYFSKTLGAENAILSAYQTQAKEAAPANIYGNIALADGSATDEFIFRDGSVMTMNTLWTTALIKQDKQWKVLKLHFSTNVFDNPVLTTAEKSIAIFAAIAALIGLIVGFFVGRKTA